MIGDRVGKNYDEDSGIYEDNGDVEFHLRRTHKGINRPSKLKSLEILGVENARVDTQKKKRGRKSKSIAGPQILREVMEGAGGVDPVMARLQESAESSRAGSYFTRATKAWMLGKSIGFSFLGSDEETIKGLSEELEVSIPSGCQ